MAKVGWIGGIATTVVVFPPFPLRTALEGATGGFFWPPGVAVSAEAVRGVVAAPDFLVRGVAAVRFDGALRGTAAAPDFLVGGVAAVRGCKAMLLRGTTADPGDERARARASPESDSLL